MGGAGGDLGGGAGDGLEMGILLGAMLPTRPGRYSLGPPCVLCPFLLG